MAELLATLPNRFAVETDAERISSFGIKPMDTLHLASALNARADWFLTTDKGILRKANYCPGIMIADPVDFVSALQKEYMFTASA